MGDRPGADADTSIRRPLRSRLAEALLVAAGVLSGAGSLSIGQAYVEATRTLAAFTVQVHEAVPSAGEVALGLEFTNGGPWPVGVLEMQVLAWQGSRYVGIAGADRRADPLDVAPGTRRQVRLVVPARTADSEAAAGFASGQGSDPWRFHVSGRIYLPRVGARRFEQTVTLTPMGLRP